MFNLRPSGPLVHDREQIRHELLVAFNDTIKSSTFANSDEMAARFLLDLVAYVLAIRVPQTALSRPSIVKSYVKNETLRFEMYLREHLLRLRISADDLPNTEPENVGHTPTEAE
jgi:hypothetical protein